MLACAGRAQASHVRACIPRHSLLQPCRAITARPTATSKPARVMQPSATNQPISDCQSLLDAFYERKQPQEKAMGGVLTLSFECECGDTLEVPKGTLALASPVLQDVMAKDPDMKSYQVSGSKEVWAPILLRAYPNHAAKVPPLTPKQVLDVFPVARHYGMSELLDECKAATEKFIYTTNHPTSADQADVLAFLEAAERLQEPWLAMKAFKQIAGFPNTSKARLFARVQDPKDVHLLPFYNTALKALLS